MKKGERNQFFSIPYNESDLGNTSHAGFDPKVGISLGPGQYRER